MFDKSEVYSFENETNVLAFQKDIVPHNYCEKYKYTITLGNEEIVLDEEEFEGLKKLINEVL